MPWEKFVLEPKSRPNKKGGNMKKGILLSLVLLMALQVSVVSAGDDPSIKGKLRKNITKSMTKFIDRNTFQDSFVIYDPVLGELKKLTLVKLHSGIVKKGDFYVSCADFTDTRGAAYDIDFLVVDNEGRLRTVEAVVHSIEGKKRKYHLEN